MWLCGRVVSGWWQGWLWLLGCGLHAHLKSGEPPPRVPAPPAGSTWLRSLPPPATDDDFDALLLALEAAGSPPVVVEGGGSGGSGESGEGGECRPCAVAARTSLCTAARRGGRWRELVRVVVAARLEVAAAERERAVRGEWRVERVVRGLAAWLLLGCLGCCTDLPPRPCFLTYLCAASTQAQEGRRGGEWAWLGCLAWLLTCQACATLTKR